MRAPFRSGHRQKSTLTMADNSLWEMTLKATQRSKAIARAPAIVYVVDEDLSVREALQSLLRMQGWQPLTCACVGDFLALPRIASPCCLLSEVALTDVNGLELQQRVSDRTEMPVIFITAQSAVETIVRAMKAGAFDYLAKPLQYPELLSAITAALERSQTVLSNQAAMRRVRECYASLTTRECQVMELVVSGWMNKQISVALGLCEITVKVHRRRVMRKMNAVSLPELVKMAATLGIVTYTRANDSRARSVTRHAAVRNRSR
jgi:FixJ family two-component response regulator